MSRAPLLIAVAGISAAIGFSAHIAWHRYEDETRPKTIVEQDEELHLGLNGLVNPLLDCGTVGVSSLKEAQVREAVERYIAEAKATRKARTISVYYRDLNNGPTFGLDASELFTPASLLKVPILIAYLKKAEGDPSTLKRTLVFDPKKYTPGNVTQNIAPPPLLVSGRAYSVEDLLEKMIVQSDNFAAAMLAEQP
ncbi:MAG: serine hydrolase, partial [Bdellovibrionota bacterium]